MLLLVAVRVCASLYAYWCQVEELTPPKRPRLCDMKEYEKRSTSDWVGLRKLWHHHSRLCSKRAGPGKFSGYVTQVFYIVDLRTPDSSSRLRMTCWATP